MTFKQNSYNLIKTILLCFLVSSCQTPKYSKVNDISQSKNILPEVQYSLSENFNPNNINCIAIGNIKDNSDTNEYKSLDKITLIRHAIYGHLSPKNYQDIELHKATISVLQQQLEKLGGAIPEDADLVELAKQEKKRMEDEADAALEAELARQEALEES